MTADAACDLFFLLIFFVDIGLDIVFWLGSGVLFGLFDASSSAPAWGDRLARGCLRLGGCIVKGRVVDALGALRGSWVLHCGG